MDLFERNSFKQMCPVIGDVIYGTKFRRRIVFIAETAPPPSESQKSKMQTRLSSSNNGFFPRLNPCYGSKFRVLGTILPKESEYEVSFDICRTPGELNQLQN